MGECTSHTHTHTLTHTHTHARTHTTHARTHTRHTHTHAHTTHAQTHLHTFTHVTYACLHSDEQCKLLHTGRHDIHTFTRTPAHHTLAYILQIFCKHTNDLNARLRTNTHALSHTHSHTHSCVHKNSNAHCVPGPEVKHFKGAVPQSELADLTRVQVRRTHDVPQSSPAQNVLQCPMPEHTHLLL